MIRPSRTFRGGDGPDRYPGDADENRMVNVIDLGILATNYGDMSGTMEWGDGDFTGEGNVDVTDLGILATNYGTSAPQASSVPEPSVAMLLAGMAICLCLRVCRGNDRLNRKR